MREDIGPKLALVEKNFNEKREKTRARDLLDGKPIDRNASSSPAKGKQALFPGREPSLNSEESSYDSAASRVNFWKEVSEATRAVRRAAR